MKYYIILAIVIFFSVLVFISAVQEQSTDEQLRTAQDRDVRTFNVSAYCPNKCCCGEWNDGTYADGTPVGGLVVAASTDIPFGTKIRIPGYGVATVRDRGGAITEGCLDLYFDTHQEALNFGRHDIECEVLK